MLTSKSDVTLRRKPALPISSLLTSNYQPIVLILYNSHSALPWLPAREDFSQFEKKLLNVFLPKPIDRTKVGRSASGIWRVISNGWCRQDPGLGSQVPPTLPRGRRSCRTSASQASTAKISHNSMPPHAQAPGGSPHCLGPALWSGLRFPKPKPGSRNTLQISRAS